MNFDFSNAPTIWRFTQSKAFVRGLIGPVGSGKSYACASEIFRRAIEQKPSPKDGIKYTRFAIVRNSYPMLKTTTLKTWMEMFPEHIWGNIRHAPPVTHHLKLPSKGDAAGVDCEVIFLALDQPKDTRKLLSLELTGGWVNEARELPKAIIDALTHRVGRYPTKGDGGPTWRGVILDNNPPDDDHWLYRVAEKDKPKGRFPWQFFHQPPGVVEAQEVPEDTPEAQGYIHAAGKWWIQNPDAENVKNLVDGYYAQILGGKNLDWIRCYAEGKYTLVQEGRPVWPEYDDSTMAADLEPDPALVVHVGLDFGLTPAASFAQRTARGTWRVLHELVTDDMGLERFGHQLKGELESMFPRYQTAIWGDPAGAARDFIYETTAFQHLGTLGLVARPCATNEWRTRREALAMPMGRLIDGQPGFLVNRSCVRTRKSLAGGYHFQRVGMGAGQERFKDVPYKDMHSHVGDATAYCLLGGGEHRKMTRKPQTAGMTVAPLDFDVFG